MNRPPNAQRVLINLRPDRLGVNLRLANLILGNKHVSHLEHARHNGSACPPVSGTHSAANTPLLFDSAPQRPQFRSAESPDRFLGPAPHLASWPQRTSWQERTFHACRPGMP